MMPSRDTQAVLLLCGSIPQDGSKPLSPTEYDDLARLLLEHGLTPAALLAPEPPLPGLGERHRVLLGRGTAMGLLLERWDRLGIWVLGRADAAYPRTLKHHLGRRCPPLLYGAGNPDLLNQSGIAVIGSRAARPEALHFAEALARQAVTEGHSVISGGAKGVDEAAMTAALAAGGRVVGVLAGGLEKAVTARKYRNALASSQLCLVGPFAPHAPFSAGLAMARNSLIYCLSQAGFVADSGLEGGTWSGATETLKRGWVPVYVRQGPLVDEGNAQLVERGARWFTPGPPLQAALNRKARAEPLGLFN
jgi:predicted Rossmann fold nucleotide-binding protein DprA/Smf involved in DNA uptake